MTSAKFDKAIGLRKLRDKSSRPVFAVWDCNYYVHRAAAVSPSFKSPEGVEIGAMYGLLSMICSDYAILQPKYCAVVFDVPGLNFRHRIDENYKFNDPLDPANAGINMQVFIAVRLLRLLGFPVFFLQGVEADDVVGALLYKSQEENLLGEKVNTVGFTGDKDLCQFVGPRCVLVDTKSTGGIRDMRAVVERFGVTPEFIADYLALCGDANDLISGVPGVGPAKARELLEDYGSIAGILAAIDHPVKWQKLLTSHNLATLRKCKALTTIRTDLHVEDRVLQLHSAHASYLTAALSSLGIRKFPPLVLSQLNAASLAEGGSLFDGDEILPTLVSDSTEWDSMVTRMWDLKGKPLYEEVRFD